MAPKKKVVKKSGKTKKGEDLGGADLAEVLKAQKTALETKYGNQSHTITPHLSQGRRTCKPVKGN